MCGVLSVISFFMSAFHCFILFSSLLWALSCSSSWESSLLPSSYLMLQQLMFWGIFLCSLLSDLGLAPSKKVLALMIRLSLCFLFIWLSSSWWPRLNFSCSNSQFWRSPRTLWKLYMLSWIRAGLPGGRSWRNLSAWSKWEEWIPQISGCPWSQTRSPTQTSPQSQCCFRPPGCRMCGRWNCWCFPCLSLMKVSWSLELRK